jgi:phosphate starvation-inducible PhoH-like protein
MAKKSRARCSLNQGSQNRGSVSRNSSNRKKQSEGRRNKHHNSHQEAYPPETADIYTLHSSGSHLDTAYQPTRSQQPLEAKNPAQKKYISAIRNNCLTFGIGPAGTGKSYCAAALAAEALENGQIERIILTRPAVEAGEQLGFLPGALDDKFAVYIDVFRDILNERLGSGAVDYNLRHGRIVAAPLAFMRGKTFSSDTFVILDEAQNTSVEQMKMFLTRIGENCKVVVNGDIKQSDIRRPNGLADAVKRVGGVPGVHVHRFDRDDIVRSGLVRALIDRYEMPCET